MVSGNDQREPFSPADAQRSAILPTSKAPMMRPRTAMRVGAAGTFLVAGGAAILVACRSRAPASWVDAGTSLAPAALVGTQVVPSATASAGPSTPASAATQGGESKWPPPCDARAILRGRYPERKIPVPEDADPPHGPAVLDEVVKTWSPECRLTALKNGCRGWGACEEAFSDHLIEASTSEEERREGLRWRIERNTEALAHGRALVARAREIEQYALSIRNVPRAPDAECLTRLNSDIAKIDALWSEIVSTAPELQDTIHMLSSAEKCLACGKMRATWPPSLDLTECDWMAGPLKFADDTLARWERLIASDRKRLGDTG